MLLAYVPTVALYTHFRDPSLIFNSTMAQKVRPAARLMSASAKCADLGAAYGLCVLKCYTNISKDACAKEFQLFRACVSSHMKK